MKVHYYEGTEQLELHGKKLPYCMIDFWRMKLSCISETMTRGSFAGFLPGDDANRKQDGHRFRLIILHIEKAAVCNTDSGF